MLFFFLVFVAVLGAAIDEMIKKKEDAVQALAEKAAQAFSTRCGQLSSCGCSYDACQSELPEPTCNEDAHLDACECEGMLMDLTESVVRIPEGVDSTDDVVREAICFSKELDPEFIDVESKDASMEWQGFGSVHGRAQRGCGGYDPRVRSWYVAASSGPKDVIIVLDRSKSMENLNRWTLATDAVKTILKTLTISDFVSVVLFSGGGLTPEQEEDFKPKVLAQENEVVPQMLRASKANKDLILEALASYPAIGATDFGSGFEKAFEVLGNSHLLESTSLCQTAILFLTDGTITIGLGEEDPNELYEYIESQMGMLNYTYGVKPKIFTYSLGNGAANVIPQTISCRNNGIWQFINDGGNLVSQMSLFYYYFSIGIAKDGETHKRSVWVEPYNFATAGTLGTSVSTPVYNFHASPPYLLGVVGTGFSLREMEKLFDNSDDLLEELISRTSYCPTFDLSYCQIESLRNWYYSFFDEQLPEDIDSPLCDPTRFLQDCAPDMELMPSTCEGYETSGKVFCNAKYPTASSNDDEEWDERTCCYCGLPTNAIVGIVAGSVGGVGAGIVALIIVGIALYYISTRIKARNDEIKRISREHIELKEKERKREIAEKERIEKEKNAQVNPPIDYSGQVQLEQPDFNPMYNPSVPNFPTH